jgi:hypothetical protein
VSDPSAVFGRLHPLVLHVPIGMLVALALLELGALSGRLAIGRRALGLLCGVNALAAVAAAGTGWVLSRSGDYGGDVLDLHQNLGIAVAVASVLCALAHAASREGTRAGWLKTYRAALFAALALLLPAGHYGATLTHGADFLFGPADEPQAEPAGEPDVEAASETATQPPSIAAQPVEPQAAQAQPLPSAATFAAQIQPILVERCSGCHGESKRKGKLALHDVASIQKGGVSGPVILAEALQESEILLRVNFPLEHEDHMPPEGKPQPTEAELALLEAWILAGAPFEGTFEVGAERVGTAASEAAADPAPEAAPREGSQGSTREAAQELTPEALAALEAARVHFEVVDPASSLLAVEFAALGPEADGALAVSLLEPVAGHVAALSLARTKAGAETLALAARMPRLKRLDLRDTPVDDGALAALRGHPALEELVLARTRVADASVDTLIAMPELRRVYLWQSGVSARGLERLAAARPELEVESGETPDSAVLEVEPELVLSSDRPLPDSSAGAPDPLAPKNSTCPVSGSPVSPKYRVIWGGQVIGFCCPDCPRAFWADPEAFLAKVR